MKPNKKKENNSNNELKVNAEGKELQRDLNNDLEPNGGDEGNESDERN